MRGDLKVRETGGREYSQKLSFAEAKEGEPLLSLINPLFKASSESWVKQGLCPPANPVINRQTGNVDDIEQELPTWSQPGMKLIANAGHHGAAVTEHSKRIDEIKRSRRKGSQVRIALNQFDFRGGNGFGADWFASRGKHVFGNVHSDEMGHVYQAMKVATGATAHIQNSDRLGKRQADLLKDMRQAAVVLGRDFKFVVAPILRCGQAVIRPNQVLDMLKIDLQVSFDRGGRQKEQNGAWRASACRPPW